jgi:PAS domain S-box-containing protein
MRVRAIHFLFLSLLFSACFWLLDAYIDLLLNHAESFHESLFHNPDEIFFRLVVSILFLIMGLISAKLFMKQERAEEKRVEAVKQAYNESRKFEEVLESLGVGVVIQDLDYTVVYENSVQQENTGDNMGELCYRAYEGRDEICGHCPMVLSLKDGKTHSVKVEIPSKGRTGHYELTTSPLRDPEGKVWGGIKLVQDITRDKEIERELKQYREELEGAVMDRTAELSDKNEALKREITEHARAEEQIRAALIEKDVLLKEIHHRVKNNMQIISSFVSLQQSGGGDMDMDNVFRDLQGRIRTMLLVHEKLYQSDDISSVNAGDFIRSLVNKVYYFLNGSGRVALKVHVDDVDMDMDALIPCGLLINELLTNSLKYAFPDGRSGEIFVELRAEGAMRRLTVSDNGIGMHGESSDSLGFRIVKALVNQLGGDMEIHRNGGVKVRVAFTDSTSKQNCWEFKNCEREPGGMKAHELGICPVFETSCLDGVHHGTHAGRACWVVAGTLCEGKVQGTFAEKENDCMGCDFYKNVLREESDNLHMSVELLKIMKAP